MPNRHGVNHEFSSSLASACEFTWCHFNADKRTARLEPTVVWDASSTGVSWLIWWEIGSFWLSGLQHQTLAWSGLHFPVTVTMTAGALMLSFPHSPADFLVGYLTGSLFSPLSSPPCTLYYQISPLKSGRKRGIDQASCLRTKVDCPSSLNVKFLPSLPLILSLISTLGGSGNGNTCTDPDFSLWVRAWDQARHEKGTAEI